MKERPILFSGPMVRAILSGAKTQTRRLLNPQPTSESITRFGPTSAGSCAIGHWPWHAVNPAVPGGCEWHIACPFGEAGDRLWVRETLREADGGWTYAADGADVTLPDGDPRVPAMMSWAHHKAGATCVSIHMPRWASRITLDVAAVRVERLQDITEEDAGAECIVRQPNGTFDGGGPAMGTTPQIAFMRLWDALNGKRAPWASDPWVWVVSFKHTEGKP